MKRLLNYLFIFLVLLLPFNTLAYGVEYDRFEDEYNATDVKTYSSGSFDLIIDDQACLLTEEEEISAKIIEHIYLNGSEILPPSSKVYICSKATLAHS